MRKWKIMVWIGAPELADQDRVIRIIRKASDVARKMQGRLMVAVQVRHGESSENYRKKFSFPGIHKILLTDSPCSLSDYQIVDLHILTRALSGLIESQKPDLLLLPSGRTEDDLAGMLSVLYRCGSLTDCVDFYADQERKIVKAVCLDTEGGRELIYDLQGAFSIMTLRNVKNDEEADLDFVCGFPEQTDRESMNLLSEVASADEGDMAGKKLPPYNDPERTISVRLSGSSGSLRPDHKSITESECIVAGGRGLGSPEKFRIIKEFAGYLHAEYATSRPNVDAGWIGQDYQVGLSGKTVSPRIYIACGISGAAHHTIGMSSSDWVLAVNIDRNEPIFDIADVGIIGDAQAVLRRVMEKLREEEDTLCSKNPDINKRS